MYFLDLQAAKRTANVGILFQKNKFSRLLELVEEMIIFVES